MHVRYIHARIARTLQGGIMSLRKRVESKQINREIFECWCWFRGYSSNTVLYEDELYSRWCHGVFASGAMLIIASIFSPLLIHHYNPALWAVVLVCVFCVFAAIGLLFCSALVSYHYDPERIFNEDWSRLTSSLDSRPDLEDGPRSLAKQITTRLQDLEDEEIRIQSEYFKLYGKSESSPKNGEELKPMFERSLYEIRCLQVAQIMFTPKVHKIS